MDAWEFISRGGNSLLLLPVALAVAVGLWVGGQRRLAIRWSLCFAGGVLVTFATKIAFIGWGVGSRTFDFTGISGHSFLAASIFPMLCWWLVHDRPRRTRRIGVLAGVGLGLLVGWSRLMLDVHSNSEVVVGLALGFAVFTLTMGTPRGPTSHNALRWIVVVALLAGMLVPVSPTYEAHQLVTKIALGLSGRSEAFTREMLQRSVSVAPPDPRDPVRSARSPA